MNKIKLLIADDHTILRDGIVSLLQTEQGFAVTGTASNGYEVMELISKNEYDVPVTANPCSVCNNDTIPSRSMV